MDQKEELFEISATMVTVEVQDAYTGKVYDGGQTVTVPSPLDVIPVMLRNGKEYPIYHT